MNSGTVNSGCVTNRANRLCRASSSSAAAPWPAPARAEGCVGPGSRGAQHEQQRRDQRQHHVLGCTLNSTML